jgi:hypothetical protein
LIGLAGFSRHNRPISNKFFTTPGAWRPSAKTIPRVMEIAKKFGLEFLPPPGT